jgi:hypothetical protein
MPTEHIGGLVVIGVIALIYLIRRSIKNAKEYPDDYIDTNERMS